MAVAAVASPDTAAFESYSKGNYADAVTQYQQISSQEPANPVWHYNLGLSYLQLKNWTAANQSLEKALQADPAYPGIHAALGIIQAQQKSWVPAIRLFDRALELNPFDLAAAYNLAVACEQKENIQKSLLGKYELLKKRIKAYQRILEFKSDPAIKHALDSAQKELLQLEQTQAQNLKTAPKSLPAAALKAYQQGNAWSQQNQRPKAIQAYKEALSHHPTYGDALYALGQLYWQQGQVENAKNHFLYTISVMPSHVGAYYHLGLCYQKQKFVPEAVDAFHNALYYRPSFVPAQEALLTLLQQTGMQQSRLRLLEHIISVDHSNPEWHNQLALGYWQQKKAGLAQQHWLALTESHPTYAPTWYHLGRLYQHQGQNAMASASYAKARSLSANRPEFYYDLAAYYFSQQQWVEAMQFVKASLQYHPNHVDSLVLAGTLLSQQDQLVAATGYLEKARQLAPQNALVHKQLGWLYLKKGARGAAAQSWQRYLQLAPQANDRQQIQLMLPRLVG